MAADANPPTAQAGAATFDKLQSNTQDVLNHARSTPEFQNAEQEAKERRIAQMMADQMSMPMSVSEVNVTGAKNIRRGFLDPIFSPLLADSLNSPKTVGDVLSKLQVASAKLSALQILREPPRYISLSLVRSIRPQPRRMSVSPSAFENSPI
ncbi:hypothetical protein ACCO45_009077 [Purpureocillium lilacinum]|uniref:Uncharacterized protein n=1 Tax=Purpureocillium lilacinum TaxID=33203 RepID=A0ACC4DLD2_PURLI